MAEERARRRLAAILAADMVGYSRLMEADEEGTVARHKAYLTELIDPKITEHHGRIVSTAGDGLLVEFSSAVDAVRCAVTVQRAISEREVGVSKDRRIQYRMGINLGDIIIDDDDILGDGVNLAARLEEISEPGGIYVSGTAFDQLKQTVDAGYEYLGEQTVKNIEKPVRVYRVLLDPKSAGKVIGERRLAPRHWRLGAAAAVIAVVVAAAVGWWQPWERSVDPVSDKPSVAVLPFSNRSGDPKQDYFSDGITEDIITLLGRYDSLTVMTFNSVLPYKSKADRLGAAGRELGVQYLIDGSVQRAEQRVRVTVRLTDASDGVLLWSQKFDDEFKDVFALQDAIARRIVGTLSVSLRRVEQQRALVKPTENLNAYDLLLRGRAQLALNTRNGNREARQLLRRASEIDPSYAAAYSWLARTYYYMATQGWAEFPDDILAKAEQLALKGLKFDPNNIEAYRILARIHVMHFQYDRALADIESALAINPNDAEAHGETGLILLWAGRPEQAIASFETAFAFNLYPRSDYVYGRGLTLYVLRRHQESIQVLERGAARYPNSVFILSVLAASYAQIGRTDEATRNSDAVRRLLPIFDPAIIGSRIRDQELLDYVGEGMMKAGFKKAALRRSPVD
jgi:TolB-like protein/class 3 adenylate cyclase/Tfp pilus assembly protein PilF